MARAMWKGAISFGLVTIPISLYPAKTTRSNVTFHMLDKKDMRPVHNKRVDDQDHEVAWDDVVKGYEYEPEKFVVVGEEDFKAANVEATQSIDIMAFVDGSEIDVTYYDTPYYTEPSKAGRKAYALLRETLKRTNKVGVAKVVIRTRQHLCAVKADGDMLICEILRWPYQLRQPSDFDLPSDNLEKLGVSDAELKMAEQLVNAMVAKWEPEQYKDTYREDLMKLIDQKVERGELTTVSEAPEGPAEAAGGKVVDIMALLKRSMEQQAGGETQGGEKERVVEKKPAHAGDGGKKRKQA
jgi:DNA end-binding protein Ku